MGADRPYKDTGHPCTTGVRFSTVTRRSRSKPLYLRGVRLSDYVPNLSRFSWFWTSSFGASVEVVSTGSGFLTCSNSLNRLEITTPESS